MSDASTKVFLLFLSSFAKHKVKAFNAIFTKCSVLNFDFFSENSISSSFALIDWILFHISSINVVILQLLDIETKFVSLFAVILKNSLFLFMPTTKYNSKPSKFIHRNNKFTNPTARITLPLISIWNYFTGLFVFQIICERVGVWSDACNEMHHETSRFNGTGMMKCLYVYVHCGTASNCTRKIGILFRIGVGAVCTMYISNACVLVFMFSSINIMANMCSVFIELLPTIR